VSYAFIGILNLVFDILIFLIFVDVIGSWIQMLRVQLPDAVYRLLHMVHSVVAPIMEPIRRIIPPIGGLDLTPLVALIGLQLIQRVLISVLVSLR
jgi:YggT family protein